MGGVCSTLKQLVFSVIVVLFSLLNTQWSHAADAPQLTWTQLSSQQQKVLKPLAKEWDTLRAWQRAKMLDIARDFPKMDEAKQRLVQERLTNWSRMTPYEREQARKHHQQFKNLPPEKQAAVKKQWEAYEKLSEAEREKLRQGAHPDALDTDF